VAVDQKGLTLVPLNLHLKGSWIKLTLGLAKGRKLHDKRQDERRKDADREVRSALARI
jgi:SsrA-binding protein